MAIAGLVQRCEAIIVIVFKNSQRWLTERRCIQSSLIVADYLDAVLPSCLRSIPSAEGSIHKYPT